MVKNYPEMYSINDENIRNILETDPDAIKEDSSLERYYTLKFSTSEQAKEWLLKQDSNFIHKNNVISINEIEIEA